MTATDPAPVGTPPRMLDLACHGGIWLLDERAEAVAKASLSDAWRAAREAYPEAADGPGCAPHIRTTVAFVPAQHTCRYCGQQMAASAEDAELQSRYIGMVAKRDGLYATNVSLAAVVLKLTGQLAEAQAAAVRSQKRGEG